MLSQPSKVVQVEGNISVINLPVREDRGEGGQSASQVLVKAAPVMKDLIWSPFCVGFVLTP